jgi:hypothetical protein
MFRILLAVVGAAIGASIFVGAFSLLIPEAAAVTAEPTQANAQRKPDPSIKPIDKTAKARCVQTWPHYEEACLRDSRDPGAKPRVVRVIAIDSAAAAGNLRPRR